MAATTTRRPGAPLAGLLSERVGYRKTLLISLLIYGLVFLSAPLVAAFYHEPQVVPLLRVMAAGVVRSANGCAPCSSVRRPSG